MKSILTRPKLIKWWAWLLFFGFSYWVYGYRPIAALPWSGVDDGLYLRHAYSFVAWLEGNNAHWLGDYDYFLLSKAPLYGIFLGVLDVFCVPVRLGEFLLLAGLPYLFRVACRPMTELSGWKFYLCAAILMWLPLLPSETHLLRNALQSILTSYLLIACVGLVLRCRSEFHSQILWAANLGTAFGLCYLNREEAGWLAAVVFTSFSLFALKASLVRRCYLQLALLASLTISCTTVLTFSVCVLNYKSYGVFLTTFRRSSAFIAAYQQMTSLEPALRRHYIPIRRETRLRAYALSPTFAKLQPFLEGKSSYWTAGNEGHSNFNGVSPSENEFFVSNFEFALQYAAYCAGAKTAKQAEALFSAIAQELAAAVANKNIMAGRPGPATLAAFQPHDEARLWVAAKESLVGLMTLRRSGLDWSAQSSGDDAALAKVSLFTHSSVAPEDVNGIQFRIRQTLLVWIDRAISVIYILSIPTFLLLAIITLTRDRQAFIDRVSIAGIPLLALALFCTAMAVVETLGFRFLVTMGYNVLGYSPLSAFCASIFAVIVSTPSIFSRQLFKAVETAQPR